MTITIGRVGVPASGGGDATTVQDPHTVERQGRTITLTGLHTADTQEELVWFARQMLGLLDGDEPVVPFTCSSEPQMDGFYRLLDVQVAQEQGSTRDDGWVHWQAQLEQIEGWRSGQVEIVTTWSTRANVHSITAADMVQGLPGSVADFSPAFTGTIAAGTRPCSDGSSILFFEDADVAFLDGVFSGHTLYTVPVADYYHGCCRVEHDIDGVGTWRQVVGRADFPSAGSTGSDEGAIRLGNGLVRAIITYSNASVSDLSVQWWDGSQWDTATEFYLEGTTTLDELVYHSAQVLRCTAEFASVRLRAIPGSIGDGYTHVDVNVRRGSRWVTVTPWSETADTWQIGLASAAGGTTLTGGIRRTSNNGGGNREILAALVAVTKDTTNTRLTTGSLNSAIFGIGLELAGSSATAGNAAADQIEEWFGHVVEAARIVSN